MSIILRPSTHQIAQEQAKQIHPDIVAICQLNALQKKCQEILANVDRSCALLKTAPFNDQQMYLQIVKLSKTHTKYSRMNQESNSLFWLKTIHFWENHKEERSNLLKQLYPVGIEEKIEFKIELKTKQKHLPLTPDLNFAVPTLELPNIKEETAEAVYLENQDDDLVATPSPLKKQKHDSLPSINVV